MSTETFNTINAEKEDAGKPLFKTARNAAAGMLRHNDPLKVRGLRYLAYNLVGDQRPETEQLADMRQRGLQTVPYFSYSEDSIDTAISYIKNFDRAALDYTIDGLVIKSNRANASVIFGATTYHPKNMVAYKFPSIGAWTQLQGIEHSLGRQKVTPVAIIQPVMIGNTTISRVSLHNWNFIHSLGQLSEGCKVYVVRSKDVIPQITERVDFDPEKLLKPPTHCPKCQKPLLMIDGLHFCTNADCRGKLLRSICHMASRDALNIEGLSAATAQKLIDAGLKHTFDLFALSASDFMRLPNFAEKSAGKLFNAVQSARKTELHRFLYSLGIMSVGCSASADIAATLGTYEEIVQDVDLVCPTIF